MEGAENPHAEGKLLRSWTFWSFIPDRYTVRDAKWSDFLHQIGTIATIDEFWSMTNSLEQASKIPKGCRLYVFKSGVVPLWEMNIGGWEISMEKQAAKAKKKISDKWTDSVISMIGESFKHADVICGAELNVRPDSYRISLWTTPCEEEIAKRVASDLQKIILWAGEATIKTIVAP